MNNTLTLNPLVLNRYSLVSVPRISLRFFWALSLISVLALLFFYIIQVNLATSESYQIHAYQKELNKLSQANEFLEINTAQIGSLGNIEKEIKDLGFEKLGTVSYIKVLEGVVAAK
ncbi:hypothetical protein KKB68_02500 [Patescibacteria group bacterium]|nr:hypothetical protein [Patescibacteria group bacterium]